MGAPKGRTPWNKGIKSGPNPEHSKRMMGKIPWNKGLEDSQVPWNKGVKGWTVGTKAGFQPKGEGPHLQPSTGRYAKNRRKYSRIVAENILRRPLKSREIIHHINENKADDRPENLYLFRHRAAHGKWHAYLRRHKLTGDLLKSNLEVYVV